MKTPCAVPIASLALAVSLGLLPDTAAAGSHFRAGGATRHGFVHDGFAHHRFPHTPFGFRHRFFFVPAFVPIVPFGFSSQVVVVSTPPPAVYDPPRAVYAAPPAPVAVQPPPPPPPPPMPRVVEYPHGRYELRGDGVTTAYMWVWVPKPPPVPPPPPPPPAEQTPTTPPPAPRGGVDTQEASRSTLYCYTDDRGVTTWTDRLENIPARYRTRASRRKDTTAAEACGGNMHSARVSPAG